MTLTEYETTVVIRPDIGGDAVEATLDRLRDAVRNGGGKLLAISHWGKRKLAYEIKKHARGIFVHTHYLGQNLLVAELERNLRISDSVLRFLTVRLARDVASDAREEKAYERPQYDVDTDADNDNDSEFGGDERRERERDDGDDNEAGPRRDDADSDASEEK